MRLRHMVTALAPALFASSSTLQLGSLADKFAASRPHAAADAHQERRGRPACTLLHAVLAGAVSLICTSLVSCADADASHASASHAGAGAAAAAPVGAAPAVHSAPAAEEEDDDDDVDDLVSRA